MPLIEARGVVKAYGGVRALSGVDIELLGGEVHALCGENGAGKSTLNRILCGAVRPNAGEILLDGLPVQFASVAEAEAAGIAIVHQEPTTFPDLDAVDNIGLMREMTLTGGLWLDRASMQANTISLLAELGESFDPSVPLETLSPAQRQMVSIARATSGQCRLLILDEPTSSLSGPESEALFRVIAKLKNDGVAILYVSHRLEEIALLADRVTVLRDGLTVWSKPIAEAGRDEIVRAMVGREVLTPDKGESAPGKVLLEVRGLSQSGAFQDVSFQVRAGEIVGLAGLVGAGRSEVARALFGITTPDAGEVLVDGKPLLKGKPSSAISAAIAMVPEDRQQEGLHLALPIRENLSMAILPRLASAGWVKRSEEASNSQTAIAELSVKTSEDLNPANSLSGGNQQKVLIGKWLATQPRILILDEPTRGVDVGSKAEIHRLVRKLADEGVAVLVISSELPEILALSDRTLVMRQGSVSGELTGEAMTQDAILQLALPLPEAAHSQQKPTRTVRRELYVAAFLALLVVGVGIANPSFLAASNARDVLIKIAPSAIIACGMTLVILAREIDVSVGSSMGLAAAVLGIACSADRLGLPPPVSAGLCIGVATLVGAINGVLIAKAKISSIIVTLGMMTLLQGLTEVAMGGKWIEKMPPSLRELGTGSALGVPYIVLAATAAVLMTAWITLRTPFGRRVVALGSNPHAAATLGVPNAKLQIAVFALTGFFVGIATLFSATQLQVIEAGFGRGMELTVIAAVVVGGTSIRGGRGSVIGSVLGAVLLGIIGTALIFLRLGPSSVYWERAIQGLVILVAVVADAMSRRRKA
ncbi:MAG: ATP-binding cassette domain-containing protein [Fimbriimonadaceae bacterium]|nr:ATP-binding cassette domain-containing protein [Fimbriimonadaceae bacterium]